MEKSDLKKANHSGFVKKSIVINATQDKAWKKISNIVGLPEWVLDVKKTIFLSKKKKGIGAIRNITFNDGNTVEEHVVGWKNKEYFSYIAVNGLPLRAYHATISIFSLKKGSVKITWHSYLNSEKMTVKEFNDFLLFMEMFYQTSLKKLKIILEK